MARRPRLEIPGVPQHIIQRGNNRAACFFSDDDRRLYLWCLRDASAKHRCAIHAYALMSNHVHLLVTPLSVGGVAGLMQDLGRKYVRMLNAIHERTGTLWEGRYKSCLVDSASYYLVCHRYIELNPVRASIVEQPGDCAWSSHQHYAYGRRDRLIEEHSLYRDLGGSQAERQSAFRALFAEALDTDTLERIRCTTNQGWALGSDDFLEKAATQLGRTVRPPKRGRPAEGSSEGSDESSDLMLI